MERCNEISIQLYHLTLTFTLEQSTKEIINARLPAFSTKLHHPPATRQPAIFNLINIRAELAESHPSLKVPNAVYTKRVATFVRLLGLGPLTTHVSSRKEGAQISTNTSGDETELTQAAQVHTNEVNRRRILWPNSRR